MIELTNRIITPKQVISSRTHAIFPGSYNPVHNAHFGMAQEVQERFNLDPIFTITSTHPDKGDLSTEECLKRSLPINEKGYSVLFTENDGLFIDKAKAFPGYHFVIGADTLERLLDPKYGINYIDLISLFENYKTRFICFDRIINNKIFSTYDILKKIFSGSFNMYLYMFKFGHFTMNISSTELRAQNGKQ